MIDANDDGLYLVCGCLPLGKHHKMFQCAYIGTDKQKAYNLFYKAWDMSEGLAMGFDLIRRRPFSLPKTDTPKGINYDHEISSITSTID